jgi:hypothetical protein
MRILVVGSLRHDGDEANKELFKEACRAIGRAFALAKIELVVGSDSPSTADRFIVEGASSVAGLPTVWIIRSDFGPTPFSDDLFAERIRFRHKRVRGTWSVARVPQILESDGLVLVGGGRGTVSAGQIAPALNKPVLAIASFGGAAEEMWPLLEPYYRNLGEVSGMIDSFRERWRSENAELAVRAIQELVGRRVFDPRPRLPLGIFLTSLVVCLALWVVLFANPLSIQIYSFFSMLALAGILGTILRTAMRLILDSTARFAWNQLMLELAAGLLLGFALALLYLLGAITITGSSEITMVPCDPASFRRIAVVMTLLGLGGGLALEQASDRVSRWFNEQFRSDTP